MAICCPKACSRLTTAAIFLGIGIIQIIAGMILLRSKYVYLLSAPNFWTASANIVVGSLLGVSAAVWKTINKKYKHAARRHLLAALVSSVILLNGTTAGILIVGESNTLLSIHLESNKMHNVTSEILAYAYATSVCSPIICIVISITFLTGMCFNVKHLKNRKSDFKSILDEDKTHTFSWVYTPKLNKPDPEVLKTALSSDSSSTSDESSSSLSSSVSPKHLPSHSSLRNTDQLDCKSDYLGKTRVLSDCSNASKSSKVYFESESNSTKKNTLRHPALNIPYVNSSTNDKPIRASLSYKQNSTFTSKKSNSRTMPTPKVLFREYPSEDHMHETVTPSCTGDKDSYCKGSLTPQLQMVNSSAGSRTNRKTSVAMQSSLVNSPSLHEDSLHRLSNSFEEIEFQPYQHEKIRRTSTVEFSKEQEQIPILNNSEIPLDPALISREIYPDNTCKSNVNLESPSVLHNIDTDENIFNEVSSIGENSIFLKNSGLRSKLSAKLIPASMPVISDKPITSSREPLQTSRTKHYSKSKKIYHNYVDCHRNGLSSFKNKRRTNEVDAVYPKKHVSVSSKSPMESISELSIDESCIQPSTSMHTSGYISALEEESDEDSDHTLNQKIKFQSSTTERSLDESVQSIEKRVDYSSLKKHLNKDFRDSLQKSLQDVMERFMKENPDMNSADASQMLKISDV